MPTMDEWARDRISEASPDGPGVTAALQQLFEVVLFFEGRRGTVFGMTTTPEAFATRDALVEQAKEGLRAWFQKYSDAGDKGGCRAIYDAQERFGTPLALPVPPEVAAEFERRARADQALATLPTPLQALTMCSKDLGSYTESFMRDDTDPSWIAEHAKLFVPNEMGLVDFEFADDAWNELPGRFVDPRFFPLGGADGDLFGLHVLRADAGEPFRAPVVYYFHEDDPPFTWTAESLGHFDEMIRAAIGNKGKHRAPKVAAARGTRRPDIESAIAATYDAERADTEERKLVHALLWSSDEAARVRAADALETIYAAEATAHPYALHSLRAQKILRSR